MLETKEMQGGGIFSDIIIFFVNSDSIYEAMAKLTGASALILWLLAIFMGVRIFQEGLKATSAKAAMAEAIMNLSKTVLMYLAYTSVGTFLFGFIFIINELFEYFGSINLIGKEIVDLREKLFISERDYKTWVDGLYNYAARFGNIISAPSLWSAYQAVSLVYVFIVQLIDVLFAVAVSVLYVWGFVAIGTMSLSKPLDISAGWVMSVLTLFVWAMIEPILLGLIYIMIIPASEAILRIYSDVSIASISVWYLFTTLVLVIVMLFKILAPFIALILASNKSIGGLLGATAALPATVLMHQTLSRLGKEAGRMNNLSSGIVPDVEGLPNSSAFAQNVGPVANAHISDVGKIIKQGLGNLSSKGSK